jgi:hypothetical protein
MMINNFIFKCEYCFFFVVVVMICIMLLIAR